MAGNKIWSCPFTSDDADCWSLCQVNNCMRERVEKRDPALRPKDYERTFSERDFAQTKVAALIGLIALEIIDMKPDEGRQVRDNIQSAIDLACGELLLDRANNRKSR